MKQTRTPRALPLAVACAVAVTTLSGCKTLPTQMVDSSGTQPAVVSAPATPPAGCKPVYGPSRNEAVAAGSGIGALLGAAIGGSMAKKSGVGARNGLLFGALAGALAGSAYANEMGLTEQADGSIKLNIPGKVLFGSGSADVTPAFKSTLERVASTLREYCDVSARVVGHTDNVGGVPYNESLSLRRARSVAASLTSLGVERQIQVEGMGPHAPVAGNTTEDGRATNRRVELFIVPPARN